MRPLRKFRLTIIPALLLFMQAIPQVLPGQNAPVTTLATVGNAQPGQVQVPITVTGFNAIGAISLTFDYAWAGLHFLQGSAHPGLQGFAIGDHNLGNGKHRVTMGWFGTGTTLPDGSVIMTVTFSLLSGTTALEFVDNGPSCEYADSSYNVLNDLPQNTYYIDGTVCCALASPGTITGSQQVCSGSSGVPYSIAPIAGATGYAWSLPPGAVIATGANTNAITVNFPAGCASGMITVNPINACGPGPSSQLPVTVNPLPVANAGADVSIPYGTSTTLHAASAGAGSFSYHWSPEALLVNPNLQDALTVNLTATTLFTLSVKNLATSCENSDQVVVTITGGPLTTSPTATPSVLCTGSSCQLTANAGGGSGNYSYSWTCNPPGTPPWSSFQANPVVFPEVSTSYILSVNDGFNITTGSVPVTVNPLPTAHLSGGDTLCGEGNATLLQAALTGTAPWNFYYSNGTNTWFVPGVTNSPYTITATEAGFYTILSVTDAHCTGIPSGSAVVARFPVPPTPAIIPNGTELSSSGCCGNQWYKEGILIPGAVNQNFEPVQSAHYFTIVTIDGCASDTSNVIYFFMAGQQEKRPDEFSIRPVPVNDRLDLVLESGWPADATIRIRNAEGRIITTLSTVYKSDIKIITTDTRTLLPGLYVAEVTGKNLYFARRFLIVR